MHTFVLRIVKEALGSGSLRGALEDVSSGESYAFVSGEDLLTKLSQLTDSLSSEPLEDKIFPH